MKPRRAVNPPPRSISGRRWAHSSGSVRRTCLRLCTGSSSSPLGSEKRQLGRDSLPFTSPQIDEKITGAACREVSPPCTNSTLGLFMSKRLMFHRRVPGARSG